MSLPPQLNSHAGVITDWSAGHTTAGSALNGSDFIGNSGASGNLFGDKLAAFIKNGSIPEGVLDDKILRWLTPYYALDQASLPELDFDRYVSTNESTSVARKLSEESMTLLKNVRSTNDTRGLPLNKPRDLLLVGSSVRPAPYGWIHNLNAVPFYAPTSDYSGWNSNGYGSGGSPVPYLIDPLNAFIARGQKEERPVATDYYGSECVCLLDILCFGRQLTCCVAAHSDPTEGMISTRLGTNITYLDSKLAYASTAVVFVTAVAMEGFDRTTLKVSQFPFGCASWGLY